MKNANLIAIKPFQPESQGGDLLLVFDTGDSFVMGESSVLNHSQCTGYVYSRARINIDNDPGPAGWQDFVLELWSKNEEKTVPDRRPTTAPPVESLPVGPLCTRASVTDDVRTLGPVSVRAKTVDEGTRSVEAVLATRGRVQVWDFTRGGIEEILDVDGADFPEQLPLLDSHARGSVSDVLGSIRNIRVQGDELIGRLFFSEGDPVAESAWQKIRGGHVTDISIGYSVDECVDIRRGGSEEINGVLYEAEDDMDLRVTTRFFVREASLVAIGADAAAKTRSGMPAPMYRPPDHSESAEGVRDAITAALQLRCGFTLRDRRASDNAREYRGISIPDVCRHALKIERKPVPRDRGEMIRAAVATATLANIFGGVAHAAVMGAFETEEDSTVGWVDEVDVEDFKVRPSVGLQTLGTPGRLPRGGIEPPMDPLGEAATAAWAIARYAKMITFDEQDADDDRLDVLIDLPMLMGRACRRLRGDLVYSTLLKNGTFDGGALFNSTAVTTAGGHANLGSGALASGTLKTAVAAMSAQKENGVPLYLRARTLIVPAELRITAMELVKNIELEAADGAKLEQLGVRSEGRLSAAGVRDPRDGTVYAGSDAHWFLAAAPGRTVRLGFLRDTNRAPQVRSGPLKAGQWGTWIDCVFDIGATVLGYQGLWKSSGS